MSDNSNLIEQADALASLDGNNGWAVVESWINEAIKQCKDGLASKKKTKSMVDVARYQAKIEAFSNLLYLKEKTIERGIKAREAKDKHD